MFVGGTYKADSGGMFIQETERINDNAAWDTRDLISSRFKLDLQNRPTERPTKNL